MFKRWCCEFKDVTKELSCVIAYTAATFGLASTVAVLGGWLPWREAVSVITYATTCATFSVISVSAITASIVDWDKRREQNRRMVAAILNLGHACQLEIQRVMEAAEQKKKSINPAHASDTASDTDTTGDSI